MVKDVPTSEWGFISGGIKKNESAFQAAERELIEETSGLLTKINLKNAFVHRFYTSYEQHNIMCTLYMYEIPEVPNLSSFFPNDEVNEIQIKPYGEFTNVWSFCDDFYNQYYFIFWLFVMREYNNL